MTHFGEVKTYSSYNSPFDPCRPIPVRAYLTPPQLYLGFQPPNLPQFNPTDALLHGTLWPALYSEYQSGFSTLTREEQK